MPELREMLRSALETRANDWSQYRSLLDSITGEASAEQTAELERMDTALSTRTAEIERLERALAYEVGATTPEDEPTIPGGPGTDGQDSPELRAAFNRFIRGGSPAGLEYRALAVGTDSAGGYAVPDLFRNEVQKTMKEFGGVREVANVITTDTGQNIEWPTFNGTAQVGAIVAENVQVAELDPAFGIASLDSYLWSSKLVRVPIQLTQDSAINMEDFLRDALAERIARIQNTKFTVGTGTGEPDGVAVGVTTGVTAASATAITADELISLYHSVDPAYRANFTWMTHDNTIAAIRKLKEATTNAYIWQPGLQAGTPDTLLGRPVVVNQDMDSSLATTDVAVLGGDFKRYYVIRDVRSFELMVLKERYADYHQYGYLGFSRSDGTKADTAAVKALVMA
jgi:HK97 family phage major capsid protein